MLVHAEKPMNVLKSDVAFDEPEDELSTLVQNQ